MISRYYKAIAAALVAGLTALGTAVADGGVTKEEWIGIALAVLGTSGAVGIVTNAPNPKVTTPSDELASRVDAIEAQLPTIPDIAHVVTSGIVTGLQTLGHIADAPPVRDDLKAAAAPDQPDAETATPAQILASVPVENTTTGGVTITPA